MGAQSLLGVISESLQNQPEGPRPCCSLGYFGCSPCVGFSAKRDAFGEPKSEVRSQPSTWETWQAGAGTQRDTSAPLLIEFAPLALHSVFFYFCEYTIKKENCSFLYFSDSEIMLFSFSSLSGTCPIKLDCNLFVPTCFCSKAQPAAWNTPNVQWSEREEAFVSLLGEKFQNSD